MEIAFVNVLYLLWQTENDSGKWPRVLAEWTGDTPQDAERILGRKKMSDDLLDKVAEANHVEVEVLRYDRMIGQEEMIRENVKYLLAKLEYGEGKKLGKRVEVAHETVSKWKQGNQIPTTRHRKKIKEHLGVEQNVDLEEDPIFLLQEPLTDEMRRADLREQIDVADERIIRKYYEAIKKLLSG